MALEYRNVYWLWLSLGVITLDQITKQLVVTHLSLYDSIHLLDFLNLTYMHNTGAAFSLLQGAPRILFIGLGVAVSVGIMVWLHMHPTRDRLVAVALSLILGGALGNVIDRAARGYVIDFIDFHVGVWHWPAFNVADSAVTIGAAILILEALWPRTRAHTETDRCD